MTELPSLTTFIEFDHDETHEFMWKDGVKWNDFVDGEDGYLYGIPKQGSCVVRFNPLDKSIQEIGPEFDDDDDAWWVVGVRAKNGCIYCVPGEDGRDGILKICTVSGEVEVLDHLELPYAKSEGWISGALSPNDGNIYFMPYMAENILIGFDPETEGIFEIEFDECVHGKFGIFQEQ